MFEIYFLNNVLFYFFFQLSFKVLPVFPDHNYQQIRQLIRKTITLVTYFRIFPLPFYLCSPEICTKTFMNMRIRQINTKYKKKKSLANYLTLQVPNTFFLSISVIYHNR